jgi:hypothetical protein
MSNYYWNKEEKEINLGKHFKNQGIELKEAIQRVLSLTENEYTRQKYLGDIQRAYGVQKLTVLNIRNKIIQDKIQAQKPKKIKEQKPKKPRQLKLPFHRK